LLNPAFVALFSLLFGLVFGSFAPYLRTFDEKYNCFYGGILDVWCETIDHVKKFKNFNLVKY